MTKGLYTSEHLMRAMAAIAPGSPEVLRLVDVSPRAMFPTDVRIRVEASGVSHHDTVLRRAAGHDMWQTNEPVVLGCEVSGRVESVGTAVRGVTPGQRVCAICWRGGYGELAVAPEECVTPLPDRISIADGAGFALAFLTAWHILESVAQDGKNQTVLIHAAAGATGAMLVQLAKARGLTVIATAGSEMKCAIARRLGADWAINYEASPSWAVQSALELTRGKGVDVVADGVGATTFGGNLLALRRFGRVVLFGQASGPVKVAADSLLKNSIQLSAFSLTSAWFIPTLWQRGMNALREALENEAMRLIVARALPLSEAQTAHSLLERRATVGRTVLYHADPISPADEGFWSDQERWRQPEPTLRRATLKWTQA